MDQKALEDIEAQVTAQITSYLQLIQEARDRGFVLENAEGLQKQFRVLQAI